MAATKKSRQQNQNQSKTGANKNGRVVTRTRDNRKNQQQQGDKSVWGSLFGGSGLTPGYLVLIAAIAVLCGFFHYQHISYMFESDRHFSHLSSLEREFTFRTEMGLYYSYYKTIIEAESLFEGLHSVMRDNITEYPAVINTLKRFNLYPEVVLGIGFRIYDSITGSLGIKTKECFTVNRGGNLPPVQSCEGFGDPAYFYVDNVFFVNGVGVSVLFLLAVHISGSLFGGLLSVVCFFYNHGEATRVQWTPPLRESFAYPFLLIQLLVVTHVLKISRPNYKHSVLIAIATVSFMLPWQFAQFALLTQSLAVFAVYALRFIGSRKIKIILIGQSMGLVVSYLLLFGNEMLLTSFFFSALVTIHLIVYLEPFIEKLKHILLIWVAQGVLLLTGLVGVKFLISKLLRVADDAHIADILRSKFSTYKNFHTMLYTCAVEFDFLGKEPFVKLSQTLVLPACVVGVLAALFTMLMNEYRKSAAEQATDSHKTTNNNIESEYRSKQHSEVLYHIIQLAAYSIMAVLIMRLKLFWTPHLCLLASLLASDKFFPYKERVHHLGVLGLLLAGMSVIGYSNLKHEWSIQGEFSNAAMEEMIEWVNSSTHKNAVFGGPMPTMATIKLCTGRPIVNHPHYEDVGLRARTKKVYSMYSRKPRREVWQNYRDLQVDYVILENSWCYRSSGAGCAMPEIWDIEDEENRGNRAVCKDLNNKPSPEFKSVFKNNVYHIMQVEANAH
ncbi:protein C-mannosyl-transferase DPY19L1-like [Tubulanus polymorphus]|uniref:protein C-mannosyl-transferase DPY19L1-like n=1 Tax=Tubulanus polymorphus TaxID=672921 RepID=UPI003DA4AF40